MIKLTGISSFFFSPLYAILHWNFLRSQIFLVYMWVCTIFSFNSVKETGRNPKKKKKNHEQRLYWHTYKFLKGILYKQKLQITLVLYTTYIYTLLLLLDPSIPISASSPLKCSQYFSIKDQNIAAIWLDDPRVRTDERDCGLWLTCMYQQHQLHPRSNYNCCLNASILQHLGSTNGKEVVFLMFLAGFPSP